MPGHALEGLLFRIMDGTCIVPLVVLADLKVVAVPYSVRVERFMIAITMVATIPDGLVVVVCAPALFSLEPAEAVVGATIMATLVVLLVVVVAIIAMACQLLRLMDRREYVVAVM